MKIGIDIRTLMDAEYSGVPEYTLNLIKGIFALDKNNEYKLFYNSARDLSGQMPVFDYPNVQVLKFNYPNKIFNYLLEKTLRRPQVDKLLGGVDLFWMPHLNFVSLSGACRSFLTIHDLSFWRYPEFFSLKKNIWHYLLNVRKLSKGFDKIIAVSENTKDDLMELLAVKEDKIEIIYPGVGEQYRQIRREDTACRAVKDKYGLPEKFILYLGTLEPRKNVVGIIRAYDRLLRRQTELQDFELVLAGGQGWKSRDIFREKEKAKFKNNIKFLGYVAAGDKPGLYNLASLFCYPSFYEGFGLPPLEAMACGTPVITGFNSSLGEVAGEAALLVDADDINSITEAMRQIIMDNGLRNTLAARGPARAEKFRWSAAAAKYLVEFMR